jgi:uncharacterized membrane protein YbhN (UPF0104 family)
MVKSSRNRVLTISLALAASGILTSSLALLDVFCPQLSTLAVLAFVPLLGAIVLGTLMAFAWTCEALDRRGYLRGEQRVRRKSKMPRHVVSARGPQVAIPQEHAMPAMPLASPRPLIHYPVNLRGTIHFSGNRWASGWHGQ